MNKIRYWTKLYLLACGIYDNEGKNLNNAFLSRVFNICCELGDYIENLKLRKEERK